MAGVGSFPPVFSVFLRQMLPLCYQAIQLGSIRVLFLPELCALNCGVRTKNNPSLPSPSFISPPSSSRHPTPCLRTGGKPSTASIPDAIPVSPFFVLTLTQKQVRVHCNLRFGVNTFTHARSNVILNTPSTTAFFSQFTLNRIVQSQLGLNQW